MLKRALIITGAVFMLLLGTLGGAAVAGSQEYPPTDDSVVGETVGTATTAAVSAEGETQGELARTGQDGLGDLVRLGAVLVAVGGLVVIAVRRQRSHSAPVA